MVNVVIIYEGYLRFIHVSVSGREEVKVIS